MPNPLYMWWKKPYDLAIFINFSVAVLDDSKRSVAVAVARFIKVIGYFNP